MTALKLPHVLVLGVGGVLGEAWMSGFLAGAAERSGIDFRRAEYFIGTSAGSVVAARLAAGVPLGRPGEAVGLAEQAPSASVKSLRTQLERLGRLPLDAALPVAEAALRLARPGRALARAILLASLPPGRMPLDALRARIGVLGARFDGRLRVVAVDVRSGRRVVFGAPDAPAADVPDAVAGSCAIPGLFRPVRIGSRDYIDGGAWSPTNLDAAPVHAGSRVLCLVPTAALAAHPLFAARTLARGWEMATAVEAGGARKRGAQVTIVRPDSRAARVMGTDLMDARRRDQAAAAGFAQGLTAAGTPVGSAS
jgi:NTE family protein